VDFAAQRAERATRPRGPGRTELRNPCWCAHGRHEVHGDPASGSHRELTAELPYQRTGSGTGVGWQNEFETIRIRLADFLTDGSHLDLRDIVAVRFDFGPHFGSAKGRLALDDVELIDD
jgi:hypothetical protein